MKKQNRWMVRQIGEKMDGWMHINNNNIYGWVDRKTNRWMDNIYIYIPLIHEHTDTRTY